MNLRDAGATVAENFKQILEVMEGTVAIIDNKAATFHAAAEKVLTLKELGIRLQASAKVFGNVLQGMKADTHDYQTYASGFGAHTGTLLASLEAWKKHYTPGEVHDRKEDIRLKNHLKGLIEAWVKEYLPPMFNACAGMGMQQEKVLFLESEVLKLARKLRVKITLRLSETHDP